LPSAGWFSRINRLFVLFCSAVVVNWSVSLCRIDGSHFAKCEQGLDFAPMEALNRSDTAPLGFALSV
jgi:hypothetical protein